MDFRPAAMRLRELAFLNPGIEIVLTDERAEKTERFIYRDGIEEFVRQLGKTKQVLHPKTVSLAGKRQVKVEGRDEEVFVDCVLQYNDSYTDQILCFANSISNPDGGTHLTGFRRALTSAIASTPGKTVAQGRPGDPGRCARRPGLCAQREAAESALRVADQGQAGQHRDRRHRVVHRV
jgi:DNA gyrase subunit B